MQLLLLTLMQMMLMSSTPDAPTTLEDCYLKVAAKKGDADMAYIARELCDAVFKPKRRSLVVLDPKSQICTEWWLDPRGRYETAEQYCAFEPAGKKRWTLACQDKTRGSRYSLVYLREVDTVFSRDGDAIGSDPGRVFGTLARCIESKLQKPGR